VREFHGSSGKLDRVGGGNKSAGKGMKKSRKFVFDKKIRVIQHRGKRKGAITKQSLPKR